MGNLDGLILGTDPWLTVTSLDGALATSYDVPVNWVQGWNGIVQTNDMNNAYNGEFDPRHMYGVTNQDVFRWPGIRNGTLKQNLGMFIITLQLPGIPMLSWGEGKTMLCEECEDVAKSRTRTSFLYRGQHFE